MECNGTRHFAREKKQVGVGCRYASSHSRSVDRRMYSEKQTYVHFCTCVNQVGNEPEQCPCLYRIAPHQCKLQPLNGGLIGADLQRMKVESKGSRSVRFPRSTQKAHSDVEVLSEVFVRNEKRVRAIRNHTQREARTSNTESYALEVVNQPVPKQMAPGMWLQSAYTSTLSQQGAVTREPPRTGCESSNQGL